MSDDHDESLWSGQGPVSPEIAGIERELRSLAWRPRELPLAEAALLTEAAPPVELRERFDPARHRRAREWLPLVAGLAAAAVVLAVLAGLRGRNESPAPNDPPAHPSGSPELRDPFSSDAPELPTPSTIAPELVDPFADDPQPAPRHGGELVDPFAAKGTQDEQHEQAPPPPRPHKPTTSPDLKDPFAKDEQSGPREPATLHDPFAGQQREPQHGSPDLMDPFRR